MLMINRPTAIFGSNNIVIDKKRGTVLGSPFFTLGSPTDGFQFNSFTRNSVATITDVNGTNLTNQTADQLRSNSFGVLFEDQSINQQQRSLWQGASASPSTYPSNMGVDLNSATSATVTGVGVEEGMNYIEITFVNTSGSTRNPTFRTITNSRPAAAQGQVWSSTFRVKTISSTNSVSGINRIYEWSAAALTNNATNYTSLPVGTLVRSQVTYTLTNASTTGLRHGFQLAIPNNTTSVIRFYTPQLELYPFATSFIPTDTTAVTREKDVGTVTNRFQSFNGTIKFTLRLLNAAAHEILSIGDLANGMHLFTNSSGNLRFKSYSNSVNDVDWTSSDTLGLNIDHSITLSFNSLVMTITLNGSTSIVKNLPIKPSDFSELSINVGNSAEITSNNRFQLSRLLMYAYKQDVIEDAIKLLLDKSAVLWDFTAKNTLFQNANQTTPVTTLADPIAVCRDYLERYRGVTSLITNGNFATDTVWTKGTGWTISGGKATKTAGVGSALSQTIDLKSHNAFEIIFTATVTAGTVVVYLYDSLNNLVSSNSTISASGSYVQFNRVSGDAVKISFSASSNFAGSIEAITMTLNHAMIQTTDSRRPILSSIGVKGDGVDDYMSPICRAIWNSNTGIGTDLFAEASRLFSLVVVHQKNTGVNASNTGTVFSRGTDNIIRIINDTAVDAQPRTFVRGTATTSSLTDATNPLVTQAHTWDGTTMTRYLNGVVDTISVGAGIDNDDKFAIFSRSITSMLSGVAAPFNGHIKAILIAPTVLTTEELDLFRAYIEARTNV